MLSAERTSYEWYLLTSNLRGIMKIHLEASHAQQLLNEGTDGLFDINLSTGEVAYSASFAAALGFHNDTSHRTIDMLTQLIHRDERDSVVKKASDFIAGTANAFKALFRVQHTSGHFISVFSSACLIRDHLGLPYRFVGTMHDISDAHTTSPSENLREDFYRVLLSDFPFAAWMKDTEGRYLVANVKLSEYLGLTSSDQLIGKTIHDFFQPEVADVISAEIHEVILHETPMTIEKEFRVSGGARWFDIHQSPIKINGTLRGIVGCAWDITQRKLVEKALSESEKRYRRVVEVSPEAIFIHCNGRFVFVNMAATKLLGASKPEELIGLSALDFVNPRLRDLVAERIKNAWQHGDNPLIEEELVRLDGSIVRVEMVSVYFNNMGEDSVLAIARDITERTKMQEELIKAQKLESLGVLAGGIAHDFNNILMAIIGNAELAMMRSNQESPVVDNLKKIVQAAAKATDLAKQMLAYSGKGKFIVELIDLNTLLHEMLYMLEVSVSKKTLVRLNLAQQLPLIEVDATQLRQVAMNLVINASEAIGDTAGVITITTGCIDCDAHYLKDVWLIEDITEGRYVYLEVADSGCGMDKGTVEKIFEPFFTTKFTGRGLGMAAVMGIIRGHKGAIKVYSEPGKGSSFKILLPASGKPAELYDNVPAEHEWKDTGVILLVDDEEAVRDIGREMLQEMGYGVLTANDGYEALELFKINPDIKLVILDLTMPRMDGEQCFRELRQIRPELKVIISSGYNEQEVTHKFMGKGLVGFIQKPYRSSILRDAIRIAGKS